MNLAEASGESALQLSVANGVTGLRDMGSDVDLILKMREATASGRVLGPRIFAAGPILDDAPGNWPFRMRVKSAEDGRSAVRLLKRRGVDLIKVHDNTPRGWLVYSPYIAPPLALQGHVGIALGDGRVLEARVPALSANRTENEVHVALRAGGAHGNTLIIPPSVWMVA